MSDALNNLFNFSRTLPSPFDTVTSKKIPVASKYGDGKQATLTQKVQALSKHSEESQSAGQT